MAQGVPLFLGLSALNAVVVAVVALTSPSRDGPAAWFTGTNLLSQGLLHVSTGFLAGALSLDPVVALLGGLVGPSIDVDHIGYILGVPALPRSGHSVFLPVLLAIVDARFHFWRAGSRNLALFLSMEYAVHMAVAPPGFPLLSPFSAKVFVFPSYAGAGIATMFALLFLWDCRRRGRESITQSL